MINERNKKKLKGKSEKRKKQKIEFGNVARTCQLAEILSKFKEYLYVVYGIAMTLKELIN